MNLTYDEIEVITRFDSGVGRKTLCLAHSPWPEPEDIEGGQQKRIPDIRRCEQHDMIGRLEGGIAPRVANGDHAEEVLTPRFWNNGIRHRPGHFEVQQRPGHHRQQNGEEVFRIENPLDHETLAPVLSARDSFWSDWT